MKKTKFIFVFGIIIGLLFIGVNVLKDNTISIEKKDLSAPRIWSSFRGGVSGYIDFYNIDKNGSSIHNSKFKLTTWDGRYTFNISELDDGYYAYNEDGVDLTLDEAWDLLSPSQKAKLNDLDTYGEFVNTFGADNTDCYRTGGYTHCYTYMGTYYTLEQTQVTGDYTKEKYIVPGVINFEYMIDEPGYYDDGNPIPNSTSLAIASIYYYPTIGPSGVLLKYGDYDELFDTVDYRDYDNIINSNIAYTINECIHREPNLGSIAGSTPTPNLDNLKKKVGPSQEVYAPFYYECYPVVVNKKGEVNLSINTTVNEKESISTTSNSKLTYRVNIKNNGITTYDNTIISKLPPEFVYVDGTASNGGVYNPSSHTITWTLDRIDEGDSITFTYEAYAPSGLSNLKSYISEATIETPTAQNKVISNKTTVRLMANPKTDAPLYGIGITLLIVWGVSFYLYFFKRKQELLQK